MSDVQGLASINRSNDQFVSVAGSALQDLILLSGPEKLLLAVVLSVVGSFFAWDILLDIQAQESGTHIFIDTMMGVSTFVGIVLLWGFYGYIKHRLFTKIQDSQSAHQRMSGQAQLWRAKAEGLKKGISSQIDKWMDDWKLSGAEKEICYLLLKGLSSKEIANVRGTSERTARNQALTIYRKANVAGRAELAAFFLEDLLEVPN